MRSVEKRLREKIRGLESELNEVEQDRRHFRDHFEQRFRWWIKLLGESRGPSISWLVEDDAKWLVKFKWWGW